MPVDTAELSQVRCKTCNYLFMAAEGAIECSLCSAPPFAPRSAGAVAQPQEDIIPPTPSKDPTPASEPLPVAREQHKTATGCVLCRHADAATFDSLLHEGTSMEDLSERYGHSTSTWSRHRRLHLGLPKIDHVTRAMKGARMRIAQQQAQPRSCAVCKHQEAERINTLLREGVPGTQLQRRYGISNSVFSRHRLTCLGLSPLLAKRPLPAPSAPIAIVHESTGMGACDFLVQVHAQMGVLEDRIATHRQLVVSTEAQLDALRRYVVARKEGP